MTTYAHPTAAYRTSSVLTASSSQLVVMLYDGARRFLHQASVAMGDRQAGVAGTKLTRAEDILRHLRATLDLTQGEIAERLGAIYTFCLAHCARARLDQDAGKLDEVSALLASLRESWSQVAASEGDPAPIAA